MDSYFKQEMRARIICSAEVVVILGRIKNPEIEITK